MVTRAMKRIYREIIAALRAYAETLEEEYGDKIMDDISQDIENAYSEFWQNLIQAIDYEGICSSLKVYDRCDEFWHRLLERVEFSVKVVIEPRLSLADLLNVVESVKQISKNAN